MSSQVVRALHDGFKRALDDLEHRQLLEKMNQVYWYQSSEDYAKWAEQTYKQERGLIQRLGLLAKQKGMSETR